MSTKKLTCTLESIAGVPTITLAGPTSTQQYTFANMVDAKAAMERAERTAFQIYTTTSRASLKLTRKAA